MTTIRGGYWGKILWVDLTNRKISVEEFGEEYARKYLGGIGIGTKIISVGVTKNTNPLGSSNIFAIATGPFQATTIPGSGRAIVCAKSPLTGYWGASSGGGHLGPQLKRAGYDSVAITGKSKTPVSLWITDEKVELRDASKLWGLDTVETTDAIRDELGNEKNVGISTIGPGGENLVRYACIANEKHGFFGRCGLGAVMGSKNLKAVVTKGNLKPPIAEPALLRKFMNELLKKVQENPFTAEFRKHGNPMVVAPREENGLLPIKNFSMDIWPEVYKISAPLYTEKLNAKPWPCPNCIMGCHRRITNQDYFPADTGGPEYETLGMIGSNLLIDDLQAIVRANEILNRYGIDTVETGGILGWAFECYENNLLSKEDTDGIDLTWGNGSSLIEICEKIGKREGIGNLLAEGIRACVDAIPDSKRFAVESMGQSVAAHDPRAFFGQVITSIASTRGSCHLNALGEANELGVTIPELGLTEPSDRFDNTNKGFISAVFQDVSQIWNSLTFCLSYFFDEIDLVPQTKILNLITGWDVTPGEIGKIGERITCMQQAFNISMGLIPEVENLMPERLQIARRSGEAAGQMPDWKRILKEYWQTKGWDEHGVPTEIKIRELGLE
jgi:aldehyde:ferredoxin oxidoreductase